MRVNLYLDMIFFLNVSMNLWIITLALYKLEITVKHWRRWVVALLGACFYCLLYCVPFLGRFQMIIPILCSNIVMIVCLLPRRYSRYRIKCLGLSYFYTFLLWGIIEIIEQKFRDPEHILFFTPLLFGSYVLFYVVKGMILHWRKKKAEKVFDLIIESNGLQHRAKGLYDTGNTLLEPISKKPVCLIEEELLAQITLENPLYLRAIPFRSIGKEFGMLYGVEVPCIRIFTNNKEIVKHHVVCAGVNQKISGFDKVQIILHPELFVE